MTDDKPNADELRARDGEPQQDDRADVDWTQVATDPHPSELGYETDEWERIPTTDRDQVIFLPGNEEDLEDDAFVVLDESDLCDLVTRR
jgi:hypothetical protein